MTVNLVIETGYQSDFNCEEIAGSVVNAVLEEEGCPYEATVDITLTSDDEIETINREQRGIEQSTDVLSFPMTQYPIPGEFRFLEKKKDSFDPDTGELLLGDIVISTDHVKTQAAEYGHSEKREFAFLIAHSMLHLIGYDHMTEDDAVIMEKKQKEILQLLGITREL